VNIRRKNCTVYEMRVDFDLKYRIVFSCFWWHFWFSWPLRVIGAGKTLLRTYLLSLINYIP